MNSTQFVLLAERVSSLIGHDLKSIKLENEFYRTLDFGNDVESFITSLQDHTSKAELELVRNSMPKDQFSKFASASEYPLIVFAGQADRIQPALLHVEEGKKIRVYTYSANREERIEFSAAFWESIYQEAEDQIVFLTPYSMRSLLSNDDKQINKELSPATRLFRLLGAERRDIFYIYFYAIIVSLIGLSLPLGVQSIINMISGGVIFNSIVLLITIVLLGVIIAGALQVMQYTIVEVIERRIFVKAAFEFTQRIPRVRTESVMNQYAPELMNRFFDVLTIQKGLAKLLIDFTGAALQIIFGLVLLAFYHPFFVFFGIALIATIFAIFYFTGPKGLKTSLVESKYKYKVAHWLEEVARTLLVFKLAGHTSLPMQKMDDFVNNYLHYRKKHFKVLMGQFINVIGFKALVTGGILIIGSVLVIDRQITLGQFVASEIVIILIINAVEKVILSMGSIYDTLTAVEKIGHITDISLERKGGISLEKRPSQGLEVNIHNLSYQYPESSQKAINNLNLKIEAGERLCLSGYNDAGKKTLGMILSGLLDSYKGVITYNNFSLRDLSLTSLRDAIAKNASTEDIFDGTVFENVTMGKPNIKYENAVWALQNVGLYDYVNALPQGLLTPLTAGGKSLSESIAVKIILARCIAEQPNLLILQDIIHKLEKQERIKLLDFLLDKQNPWTLVCISNDPYIMASCDRVAVMKDGTVVASGPYEELLAQPIFQGILPYPYQKGRA